MIRLEPELYHGSYLPVIFSVLHSLCLKLRGHVTVNISLFVNLRFNRTS